ncbi:hypothetical protein HanPSC8_Chr07g0300551 [Helianthus annuus]|nr:hypothetical protein HanPSC8_Chr07g0300551 [Helianthus annuus]
MFSQGPISHDGSGNHKKDITGNSLCCNIKSQPLIYLGCVIRTRHNIKQKPLRNL